MEAVDVTIVGAGPAGCAAAYDLASAGYTVLLLEQRSFPRLKPCAGALTAKAILALRFSIAPVVRQVVWDFVAGNRTMGTVTFHGRHPLGAMTVRSELDNFVLRKTLEQGAIFEKIGRITGITEEADGVALTTDDAEYRSRYLIGADGANSTVRRITRGFDGIRWGFAIEAVVPRSTPGNLAVEFDFGAVRNGYGWVFPKGDHLNVGVYTFDKEDKLTSADLTKYLTARLGSAECERVVGQRLGLGGWAYVPRQERVFLVGDAAGLCEPLLGEGIYYAIKSGQLAAEAISQGLEGSGPAGQAYSRLLSDLTNDIGSAYRSAVQFYGNLRLGYAALTSPIVSRALMKGYTAGVPLGEIKRTLFTTLPFRRPPSWP